MPQKVVLITSGQPSANPRLVKEAVTLSYAGYKVTVIYVPISPWAEAFDKDLFHKHPQIKFIRAGYHPTEQKWLYRWARLRRKILSKLHSKIGDVLSIADYSIILFGQELLRTAKRHKADLYIAHNLGALPVAVKAARFHKANVGFDAEDFHRGEFATDSLVKCQTLLVENKYFPQVDYLTVASALIGQAYEAIFPALKPKVINNVFSLSRLNHVKDNNEPTPLRLFWFSQTIGRNRGIENILKAIGILKDVPISLTLLGNLSVEMNTYLQEIIMDAAVNPEQVIFMAPVPEDVLFDIAAGYDVGLSSEVPYCLNREYCLTNKIFTNLIAGSALVLSDTKAQKQFLRDYPGIGSLYKSEDPVSLAAVLQRYAENGELLALHQQNVRELALKELNWESESRKFLETVANVLSS